MAASLVHRRRQGLSGERQADRPLGLTGVLPWWRMVCHLALFRAVAAVIPLELWRKISTSEREALYS